MRKLAILLLICFVFGEMPIFGSEPSRFSEYRDKGSAKLSDSEVIDRISRQVSVAAYNNHEAHAAIIFFATEKDQQNEQKKGWISRHPVLFWTLVGFGGGFTVGYATGNSAARGDPSSDYLTPEEKGLLYGGIGAGVGALLGKVLF